MKLRDRAWALLFALSAVAPLSAAHALPRLLKATPAADSRSAEAPRQVALTFNESLDVALAPGSYTVRWQVTGDDGHPVRGEFKLEVVGTRVGTPEATRQ